MKYKFALLLVVISGLALGLFGQGLVTTATKDDWEEINFEFDSSILSDGYPSLLRLAELLNQNADYRLRVEGHTDIKGSHQYNDKLAVARAETVKNFLVKYGARPEQITTGGQGKRDPKVDNKTNEGRFMNRRVTMTLTDGQGRLVRAGGVGDAIKALAEIAKKQEDCCNDILKKLDKLDEILAMLRDLKNENERLKQDVAGLKQAQSGLEKQVAEAPKPPQAPELQRMMESTAQKAIEQTRPKHFTLMGVNLGTDTTGNLTASGSGRYFNPFSEHHALQAQGEYMKWLDRQEGQFDLGLVNRFKNAQIGMFSSFKRVELKEYKAGGTLGQAAFTLDYLFSRGRIGMFGTKSFLDDPVIRRVGLARNIWEETYLHVVDQLGGSTQIGLHKDAYLEGNLGAMFRQGGSNRPGGMVRFVQPINPRWAFTVEAGLNETMIGPNDSGRVAVGLQFGNWVRPKEFVDLKHPVPVDVPRIRYELLTRTVRTGNDPPVADAGPDQIGVAAGTITLDGSGSYDPEGDPITFEWAQIAGPTVSLSGVNTSKATFTAADGQTYSFRLKVKDDKGAEGRARVTVTTQAAPQVKVTRFMANPSTIRAGQTATLVWEVLNADEVTITGLGKVDPRSGAASVNPTETTVYKLTAKNRTSEVNETLTVTVERPSVRILRFLATPTNITKGEVSTLAWETENAEQVSISGIGPVNPSGATTVSPTETTTYTLTARNRYGEVTTTATVQVAPGQVPRILKFAASPVEILPGEQSSLVWQVENATEVTITDIGKVELAGTSTVGPTDTKTYVLTAKNDKGEVSASATVSVIAPVKILDFTATPAKIGWAGETVTLSWKTENATDVVITGVGAQPANGSVAVKPSTDISYTLIAYGKRSQATAIVIVRVAAGPNRAPIANAGQGMTTQETQIQLDGSKSYDPDGDPITFTWRAVNRAATVINANTPNPIVKLDQGWGEYTFELTVTDPQGATGTAIVKFNLIDP